MTLFDSDPLPPSGRARRWFGGLVAVVAAVAVAAMMVVATSADPASVLTEDPSSADSSAAVALVESPPLMPETAVLADRMGLTAEARELFARTQPRLVGADQISRECASTGHGAEDGWSTVGCFTPDGAGDGPGRIVVYQAADHRLQDAIVTVAAHELLHAVYEELTAEERARVDELVAADTARVPADDPVHAQIASSTGGREVLRATEQFAYLGSQIQFEGGLAPELEEVYARVFMDRAALVDIHRRAVAALQDVIATVDAAWADVIAREQGNAHERAQLDADRAAHDAAVAAYDEDLDEFNATAPEEREQWTATLTPPGGEPVTMSWQESLAYRHDELERVRVDLEARALALSEAEAEAVTVRANTDVLHADALALLRAANPGVTIHDR